MIYLAHEETPGEEHKVEPGGECGDDRDQGAKDADLPGVTALPNCSGTAAAKADDGLTPAAKKVMSTLSYNFLSREFDLPCITAALLFQLNVLVPIPFT